MWLGRRPESRLVGDGDRDDADRGGGADRSGSIPMSAARWCSSSEKAGRGRRLPIWIGPYEAQAIAVELEGVALPRPLTHDLMRELVEALEARLERVVVHQLVEGTYHARIELVRAGGARVTLDARPSDALALALRLHRPIFVEDGGVRRQRGDRRVRRRGPSVSPCRTSPRQLADVLALPGLRGALVTDVDPASPARKLRRADVVTGVDGESVASAERPGRRSSRTSRWL